MIATCLNNTGRKTSPSTRRDDYMKHADNIERKMARVYVQRKHDIDAEYFSDPKHRGQKAYDRFKSLNTDYSTRKCSYLDMKNPCNTKCIFWETCKHGKHEYEWKGGLNHAQSNKENENSKQ